MRVIQERLLITGVRTRSIAAFSSACRFRYHPIPIRGDIASSGRTEIEDQRTVNAARRFAEIAGDKSPNVFG